MRLLSLFAALLLAPSALAQNGNASDPMAPFSFLVGTWEGGAWYMMPGGERHAVRQTEHVQSLLGGQVLLVQGTGRDETGAVVFEALGVLSQDAQTGQYYLDAWNDGRYVRADVTPVDGGYDWGFEAGGRTIRYAMRLDDEGRWHEVGHMVMPDGQAFPFVELTVERTSE